jgi:hypothetical protein
MKLAAIAHRGLRRDFWDLCALLTLGGIALDEVLDAYQRRFGKSEPEAQEALRRRTI